MYIKETKILTNKLRVNFGYSFGLVNTESETKR